MFNSTFIQSSALVLTLCAWGHSAYANPSCHEAEITGSSCEDLRVNFSLKQCSDDPDSGGLAELKCKENSATAEFKTRKFTYTARLQKPSDGWTSGGFRLASKNRMENLVPAEKTASSQAKGSPSVDAAALSDHFDVKLSGFVDAQFEYKKNSKTPGFQIYDGALYFDSSYKDQVELFIDIPFSVASDDDNPETNRLKLAEGKAQAFIKWNAADFVSMKVGQFDTIYGFELNDSVDLAMAQPGLAFKNALPVTHTGLVTEFNAQVDRLGDGLFRLMIANPQDTGSLNGGNLDFGAQLGFSNEQFRTSLGYLTRNIPGALGWRHFLDFLAGVSFEMVDFDIQLNLIKNPDEKTGYAAMTHLSVNPTETWGFNARFDLLDKINYDSAYEIAVGPHAHPFEPLTLKLDYAFENKREEAGGSREKEHKVIASAIYKF